MRPFTRVLVAVKKSDLRYLDKASKELDASRSQLIGHAVALWVTMDRVEQAEARKQAKRKVGP